MGPTRARAHWRSARMPTSWCWIPQTVRSADLDETDYTSWERHAVTAWPSVTVLRGKVEGASSSATPRKAADDILRPPGRLASWIVVRQATRRAIASIIRRELLAFAYSPAGPKAEAVRGP
jgi:hypothetical protein